MTDVLIKQGAEDWVNHANELFNSQLINDTGAVYDTVQGLNGFSGKNMVYRVVTLPTGLKMIYFSGWIDNMPTVPKNSRVDAFKIPVEYNTSGYTVNESQVIDGHFKVLEHKLSYTPNTGTISFTNPYDYDVSNFNCGLSLTAVQVGL